MNSNAVIDYENGIGRSSEEVLRRLYLTENPFSLQGKGHIHFDICNKISKFFEIPVYFVRAAGSGQTGCSFHNNREFQEGESDYDVAVISGEVFERYLRAVQRMALPNPETLARPDRNIFPSKQGESYYNQFMLNVTFSGVLMPYQMPTCDEKTTLMKMAGRLSEKYTDIFKNINIAIYLSDKFFERKQRPNLGFYNDFVVR